MKTNEILLTSLLAAFLSGCSSMEEPVADDREEAIRLTAGIGETTRAVIDAGYASDLNVSFARIDNPALSSNWGNSSINAVRTGGKGNTTVTFTPEQNYLAEDGESALIGYYPRKELSKTTNPTSVSYTITGDEDIMATELQTGALNNKFTTFTFQHLLTQLQFKCTGSAEAIQKWTGITSITVKNIPTALQLSLDKSSGATLTATGAANQSLAVKNCPTTVSPAVGEANPPTGYLMVFPATNLGTTSAPISLEVEATYEGEAKTLLVAVTNIEGGVKEGQSHLITLTFTEDGRIAAEAGIAEWQPGSGGSSVVMPGK